MLIRMRDARVFLTIYYALGVVIVGLIRAVTL